MQVTLHRSPETLTKNSLREYTRVGLHEVGKETKVSADFIFNAFQKNVIIKHIQYVLWASLEAM